MSKQKKKKSSLFYFQGIVILVLLFLAGVYFKNTDTLSEKIEDYVLHKQEITDILGKIQSIDDKPLPDLSNKKESQKIQVILVGEKSQGQLETTAIKEQGHWHLTQISLTTGSNKINLSPLYVSQKQFFASSLKTEPLQDPVFKKGESVYFKILLKGIPSYEKQVKIREALSIYNDANQLIASSEEVARYEAPPNGDGSEEASFTNQITSLNPGVYDILFSFKDAASKTGESHWQRIKIDATQDRLVIKSVDYFSDEQGNIKNKDHVFLAGQTIYLRMNLEGFSVQDSKIAGVVDLKITNSEGALIAHKPKFAAFNETYQRESVVAINGKFNLTDPNIYFLSFKVQDFFSKQSINHEEKIIVSLP